MTLLVIVGVLAALLAIGGIVGILFVMTLVSQFMPEEKGKNDDQ